jgi:hypothetical protein
MEREKITFLGIDPSQRYQPYVYVALDQDLKIQVIGSGPLREVLAFAAGLSFSIVAINGPQRTNDGLLAEEDNNKALFPVNISKEHNMRKIEAQLIVEGINMPRTPSLEKDCMVWCRRGFKLYKRIQQLGYQYYPTEHERIYVEVQAEATFSRFAGGATLFNESSLEGRIQRQLILYEQKLPVPDAMDFFEEVTRFRFLNGIIPIENIYECGELNAIVSAFTAWMIINKTDSVECLGDKREGEIYVPKKTKNAMQNRKYTFD